jgi:hypothetical protein
MSPEEFLKMARRAPKFTEKQYDELAKKAPVHHRRGTSTRLDGAMRGRLHGDVVSGAVLTPGPLGTLSGAAAALDATQKQRTAAESSQRRRAALGGLAGSLAGNVAAKRMPAKNSRQQFRNRLIGSALGGFAGAALGHGKRLPNHDEARAALKNKQKAEQTKTAEETKQERRARIVKAMKRGAKGGSRMGGSLGFTASLARMDPVRTAYDLTSGDRKRVLRAGGKLVRDHAVPALAGAGLGAATGAAYQGIRAARNKDKNYYTGEREKLAGRKASALLGALGTPGSIVSGAGADDGKALQTSAGSYAGRELGRKAGRAFFKGKGKKPRSGRIVGEILGGALGGAAGAYLGHGVNRTPEEEQKRKDEVVKGQAKRLPNSVLAEGEGNRKLMRQFNKENRARLAKKACIDPQVDSILDNLEKEAFLGAAIKGAKGLLTSKAVRKPLSGLARKVGPGGRSMVRNAISTATKNPIRTAAGAGAALGAVRGAVKNPGTNPDGTKKSRLAAIAKNTAGGAALGAGTAYGASKLR